MSDYILALAGFYGLSGTLFKVIRSISALKNNYNPDLNEKKTVRLDLELTRMTTDVFAFTLIGTGFLLSILSVISTFNVNIVEIALIVFIQNSVVWGYGFQLSNINSAGRTGHSLWYEGFIIAFIFYFFPFNTMMLFMSGASSIIGILGSSLLSLLPFTIGIYTFYFLRGFRKIPFRWSFSKTMLMQCSFVLIFVVLRLAKT